MRALTVVIALVATTLVAGAAHAAPASPERCEAPDLRRSVSALRAFGPALTVQRVGERVEVVDVARDRVLLSASADGAEVPEPEGLRTRLERQALTEVVRDAQGRRLYSRSLTPFGARLVVIEPGVIGAQGLQILAFDDDDVYVSDAEGALLFQRHTDDEGALTLRDARCEVRVDAAGRRAR